ncbi:MAG: sulfite exporter TauE/SafE family protein [Leptolyngbyaceae cyanobacterium]
MLELGLVAALGFLGSFGHCASMCGPITVAFSLSTRVEADATRAKSCSRGQSVAFHLWLNLGRLLSYILVGAAIGGLGSVLVAGGQMAGVGSLLRRGMAFFTGGLLIFLGLRQVAPQILPKLPLLHPFQGFLHSKLQQAMTSTAQYQAWWTPALLGLAWGLIPCGFLYVAQVKAAEAGSLTAGAATMMAFGLGTFPVMVGVGASSAWLSRNRTSQLFQFGGWITLLIGVLTLMRTGDVMVDYTGHLAIVCLVFALIARPISKLWAYPLKLRRLLGVGAFILATAHTLHMLEHSWQWNPAAMRFMLPQHQWGVWAGILGLLLMLPLTLTSTDAAQRWLGRQWRSLHLLSILALLLAGVHCILVGSSYLGSLQHQGRPLIHTLALTSILILVFAVRSRIVWRLLRIEKWYMEAKI